MYKFPKWLKWLKNSKTKRVKTPTIIQMEMTECAAASLAIVLAYYKKFVTLPELRIACGVSRDGSNALNLIRAARKYGLEADGYYVSIEQFREVPLPFIAFWAKSHFLVVEGIDDHVIYVNDPASGPIKVPIEDFRKWYHNEALLFEKTADFQPSGSPPSLMQETFERIKGVKDAIVYSFLVGIVLLIPNIALPAFSQQFVDKILVTNNYEWKSGLIVGMAALGMMAAVLKGFEKYVMNRLSSNLSIRSSSSFLWHILRLPISFYLQRYPGEISNRMSLNTNVSNSLAGNIGSSFINLFLVIGYGIALFTYDAMLASIGVVTVMLNLLFIRLIYRLRIDEYAKVMQEQGKARAYAIGALQNIETIKATGTETKFFQRWSGQYTKAFNSMQDLSKSNLLLGTIPNLFSALSQVVITGLGAWRIMEGDLTLGMFLAIQMLMGSFTGPLTSLVNLSQSIQLLSVDLDRLNDVMMNDLDLLIKNQNKFDKNRDSRIENLVGSVELNNVTFGYNPNADPIVKELYLSLSAGKCIALVGASGCGKSTVAKLISGLLKPWEGEILFDNQSVLSIPRTQFTNSVALCEQEVFLFPGSIKDNITLYDHSILEEDMIRAAQDVFIHDVIIEKKGSYQSYVGEQGNNFSGGEKQRLEIARCLAKNPSILILDEATSAMDSELEVRIIQNIRRRGCACIMIAHRLSTIRNCDEIIVMDRGKIVQKGTHEELKKIPGMYQMLILSELKEGYV